MGVESKKAPPLPAPTETDTSMGETGTEVATDVSRATEKTSYSVPEDGSPITISTRSRKHDKDGDLTKANHPSQTSLLIEYFEGGKGETHTRRPSVRVRVTPSSKSRSRSSKDPDHIQITETKSSSRKPSYTRRINLTPNSKSEKLFGEDLDSKSISSYASATEESNVTNRSGNPIEIEVMPPRRHGSPLIPTGESSSRVHVLGSDVSSMPANSFLDGNSGSPGQKRSRSLSHGETLAAGAATGLATAVLADGLTRRRSRSLSRERVGKRVEKTERSDRSEKSDKSHREKSERRHKHRESRSRSVSNSEKHGGSSIKSPRRRSSKSHQDDSLLSYDSSQLTRSGVSDQKSYRSGTSKSSINNPKLLETVEDAIRRLILPELTALKKEQKATADRQRIERERRGSITPGSSALSRDSREDISSSRITTGRSNGQDGLSKVRDGEISSGKLRKKHRNDRSDYSYDGGSPRSERFTSEETIMHDGEHVSKKSGREKAGLIGALAAAGGLGALTSAALHGHNSSERLDEREERRRRRKGHTRSESVKDSYEDVQQRPLVRMPMMSEVTASDLTRSSIVSADTERPQSRSDLTPVHEVSRGYVDSPNQQTPTKGSRHNMQSLGIHHGNHSVADLGHSQEQLHHDEYELDEHGHKIPMQEDSYDGSFVEDQREDHIARNAAMSGGVAGALAGGALAGIHHHHNEQDYEPEEVEYDQYYTHQEVPPPLKYVPYNQQRRGLSPIPQSIYSYREDDGTNVDGRTNRSNSISTLNRSPGKSLKSVGSSRADARHHDFAEVRQGGLTDSELTQNYEGEEHLPNVRDRAFDEDSNRASDRGLDSRRNTNYTTSSVDGGSQDKVSAGQHVKGVGAIPDYVHTPHGVESNVASLVSASNVTGDSGGSGYDRRASYASYEDGSEQQFTSRGNSPNKYDNARYEERGYEASDLDANRSPAGYPEYELDDQGRKVTMPDYRDARNTESGSNSKSKNLAAGAVGAAAAVAMARALEHQHKSQPRQGVESHYSDVRDDGRSMANKSFKERAGERTQDAAWLPARSVDGLSEHGGSHHRNSTKFGASGLPDVNNPMPEIGHYQDDVSEAESHNSVVRDGHLRGDHSQDIIEWEAGTPRQGTPRQGHSGEQHETPGQRNPGLREAELAILAAAGGLGAGAAIAQYNKNAGHNHEDQWTRTSDERKRDTMVTNPYEGQSPTGITHDAQELPLAFDNSYGIEDLKYGMHSPGAKDEGYISSVPNKKLPATRKEVGFNDDLLVENDMARGDPFYTPKFPGNLIGLSQDINTPLYDASTGTGMDRIQSKDILSLMDHLTVRDAQRSARDTEILMTLIQAAAEMRNSFNEMKAMLADTEDVIITEVKENTDKSVQKAMSGPRPMPGTARSIDRSTQDGMMDDIPNKRRNIFRRALKGLSAKSTNDLSHIEDMLNRLLGDVEGLKHMQNGQDQYDDQQQEGVYGQDRGYEPEGHAGTSTASRASQSGQLSLPRSRNASGSRNVDSCKFPENRISTVQEGDEDDLEPQEQIILDQFEAEQRLMSPHRENFRAESVPLGTPPQQYIQPASHSNENTPRSDKRGKHKSGGSAGWIPKISRWSETTASTVANKFRSSGRYSGRKDNDAYYNENGSRSGSNLGEYETTTDPYGEDKLHGRPSQDTLSRLNQRGPTGTEPDSPTGMTSLLPPEEPKYTSMPRNSLLLEQPQPRLGPTESYQAQLENQAQHYTVINPTSPRSADWGSSNSVNRLPQNANTNRYSNTTTGSVGQPQGRASSPVLSSHDYDSPETYLRLTNGGGAPARPPKEAIDAPSAGPAIPAKTRTPTNKLTKRSPLSNEHVRNDTDQNRYSDESASDERRVASGGPVANQIRSPASLSAKLGVPARKPTGPRSMGSPRTGAVEKLPDETLGRNKNRDTFGTIASVRTDESGTF